MTLNPRVAELHGQLDLLRTQSNAIQSQLEAAGEFADHDWEVRARHALRAKGIEVQRIQQELGRIKRAEARESQISLEANFMNAARLTVSPEVFLYIMDRARELQLEKQNESAVT